ncbi:MAG: glycosyltransferase family 39 protein [Candidatus Omnitrophica bacterium]|nr:glycosyltransferase family 39 protein [Candidatus Omnitrophota bacterium]
MLKKLIAFFKKFYLPLSALAIFSYGLYLRILKLYHHKLWVDEYHQLNQMRHGFLEMIKGFPEKEFCAYLSGDYFLIYPFFKIFRFNKWGLSIPHIISTIAGFILIYMICRRYYKTFWGYLISFLIVALNGTMILHATEIRTYAVLPTLALATFYLWPFIIEEKHNFSSVKKTAIGIFFIAVIWFHVYGILIFFLPLIYYLLVKGKDKDFKVQIKNLLRFLGLILAITMPLWIISVCGRHLGWKTHKFNVYEFIPNPWSDLSGFLKGVFGNLLGRKSLYFLLTGIFFPFLVPYKKRSEQIIFLALMVLLPVGLIFLTNLKNRYWFIQRQFIWVMPYFAFFIGWSWDSAIVYFKDKLKKSKCRQ